MGASGRIEIVRRLASLGVLLCILLLVDPWPAQAHARLVATTPAAGAALAQAPQALTLTFNEPVFEAAVAVYAPDGERVKGATVRSSDGVVTLRMTPPRQRGKWTIGWRVVADDGHPESGMVTFTTVAGSRVTQVEPVPTPEPRSFVHVHATHLIWAAVGVIVGAALIAVPAVRRARR